MEHQRRLKREGRGLFGLILMLSGVLLLLENVDIIDIGWTYWPLILVLFGLYKLSEHGWRSGNGLWLIIIGLWLYISINHIFGLSFLDAWPILIIGWGLSILWRALGRQSTWIIKENHHAI
jgi:hypothetical protein